MQVFWIPHETIIKMDVVSAGVCKRLSKDASEYCWIRSMSNVLEVQVWSCVFVPSDKIRFFFFFSIFMEACFRHRIKKIYKILNGFIQWKRQASVTLRLSWHLHNHDMTYVRHLKQCHICIKNVIIERKTLNDSCHKHAYFIFKTYVMSWLWRCHVSLKHTTKLFSDWDWHKKSSLISGLWDDIYL